MRTRPNRSRTRKSTRWKVEQRLIATMRFLADESCDFAVVVALRAAGHDVALVRERCPGAEDLVVAAAAVDRLGDQLESAFVVLEPGLVRVSRP